MSVRDFRKRKSLFLIDNQMCGVYNTIMTDIPNHHTLIDFHKPQKFSSLRLTNKFISVGSCFADEIAQRLKHDCVDVKVNPFGTIYNPVSILNELRVCLSDKMFEMTDVISYQDVFFTPYHSTLFDSHDSNELLENANKSLEKARRKMHNSDVFLITYGTAVIWEYQNIIMANCHKVPQTNFTRRILTSQEIRQTTLDIIHLIQQHNPNAKIIFTISPVRHKNPDLLTNSYSKALLKVGLTDALTECNEPNVLYFPSFEIAMDQLRDYSHYRSDGVHLTDEAVDYIYDVFLRSCFDQNDLNVIERIRRLRKMMSHKTTERNQAYYDNMEKIRQELDIILKEYPTKKLEKLCNKVKKI
ncbi:MAG: GSCFA domain-containing protein [Spirochaetales bacterium]|nr:GSCFA domain-containing protein [Spirochaetales bacterium]